MSSGNYQKRTQEGKNIKLVLERLQRFEIDHPELQRLKDRFNKEGVSALQNHPYVRVSYELGHPR